MKEFFEKFILKNNKSMKNYQACKELTGAYYMV